MTIGTVASVKGGKRVPKGKQLVDYKTEHPYIRVTDFDNRSIITEQVKFVDKETFKLIQNYTISTGDIYVSIAGTIGKVGIIPDDLDGANLTENAAKITNIRGVNKNFLLWVLESEVTQSQMRGSTISTTQPKLALFRIENIKFPLAPLAEQRRIVDHIESLFAKLDEAKEKLQAVMDGFELRKAAILHKAFTGELTEQWRKEHDLHFGDWVNTTLSEVVSGFKYGTSEKSTYKNTGIPVLRIPNIGDGILDFEDMKYLTHNDVDGVNQVYENDILIIRSNGSRDLVGKCAIVPALDKKFAYASFLIRIKPSERVLPNYLVTYLNSTDARTQMFKKAKSSAGINNINSQELGSIIINVPTIPEQSAIIAVLDSLLAKEQYAKEAAEAVLAQINTMKKAILARAFRGQLGTNDPAEENSFL